MTAGIVVAASKNFASSVRCADDASVPHALMTMVIRRRVRLGARVIKVCVYARPRKKNARQAKGGMEEIAMEGKRREDEEKREREAFSLSMRKRERNARCVRVA